ncbi:MAG: sigma 54-interacting transcriptional regulator [Deltaproteobacteria bacterium]|nr:sigma 54-interacting transcriptional regulator [Deltaproteobacteria bacterium]
MTARTTDAARRRPPAGTTVTQESTPSVHPAAPVPGLVLAFAPVGLATHDRARVGADELTVGRAPAAAWCIPDERLSRAHFAVRFADERFVARDLGSRNGTFADGARLETPRELAPGTVLRAGECAFVLERDLGRLAAPGERPAHDIAGRFHGPPLVQRLRLAAHTGRHVLLHGETGAGKELAARALHALLARTGRGGPLVAQNAARFAGEDDAVSSIFGLVKGAFTGVEARPGALEQAAGGTLFLDEVHNLPVRVQRSLLRFAEDGLGPRVGEAVGRKLDVRLILGTNVPLDQAVADGRLAHDLVARLHPVAVPPLRDRRADVPGIFAAVLHRVLAALGHEAEAVLAALDARAAERLLRHDYRRGNTRELESLAALVAARLAVGEPPAAALRGALDEALPAAPAPAPAGDPGAEPNALDAAASAYERHRAEIVAAYREVDGNLTRLEQVLEARGVRCSRRWLAVFLERWGVRARRRTSG